MLEYILEFYTIISLFLTRLDVFFGSNPNLQWLIGKLLRFHAVVYPVYRHRVIGICFVYVFGSRELYENGSTYPPGDLRKTIACHRNLPVMRRKKCNGYYSG